MATTTNENISFTDYASGIRLPGCSKLAANWKHSNDVTIFRNDVIVKFFDLVLVSLAEFSYWFKFHVNIMTGSGVMTIPVLNTRPKVIFSSLPLKKPSLANLFQTIKIVSLSWNLVQWVIQIYRIQWWSSLFSFQVALFSLWSLKKLVD